MKAVEINEIKRNQKEPRDLEEEGTPSLSVLGNGGV